MMDMHHRDLAHHTSGPVVGPGDAGYDEARSVFNARFDRRPDLVLRCHGAADVKAGIDFARERSLLLSVKGGGHSYAANTVGDGGLLLDLSPMKQMEINVGARTARVGPGVRWRELDARTQAHGLAAVGGTVSTVGVAGFTLGGGNGYLSRKHGMAVDNLLAAEVVTADGQVVRAAEDANPELYWALRGGSGNFGVVTSFELALHEVGPEVLAGQAVYRFADATEVLRSYRELMAEAPDAAQCYAFVLKVPPIPEFPSELHGEVAVDLVMFHTDPEAAWVFEPLLRLGNPILTYLAPQPYVEVQRAFDAALPAGQRWESRSHDLVALSDAAIDTLTTQVGELPGAFTVAYLGAGGGAVGRVAPTATAFPHRLAPYSLHLMAGWTDPDQDAEVTGWARRLHAAMRPYATGGVYVNLLGTDEPERVPAAYGPNFERLAAVKARWDPDNLFRANHNIPPAR